MKIKLCDLVVEIENRFPFVERLCRGSECDGEPVISVSVGDDEIEKERAADIFSPPGAG